MVIEPSLRESFQDKYVPEVTTGCWLWIACISDGYGRIQVDGKGFLAHRISYELFKGPIPEGIYVCHTCDVGSCVRPDHLFLGTSIDNNTDRDNKGRQSKGERHWKSKLTEAKVLEIRAASGPYREIAADYDITQSHVSAIKTRKAWAHLP